MKLKKYKAEDTTKAMQLVKEDIGMDALILSTQNTKDGVEIVATNEFPATEQGNKAKAIMNSLQSFANPAKDDSDFSSIEQSIDQYDTEQPLKDIHCSINAIKGILEEQFANLAWANMNIKSAHQAQAARMLVNMGYENFIIDELIKDMNLYKDHQDIDKILKQLIMDRIPEHVANDDSSRIKVFVGSSGVGKTSAIAKLAAADAMQLGSDNVAIISTDFNNIGASEQLKIFSRILDVKFYIVENEQQLIDTISKLSNVESIYIDSSGINPMSYEDANELKLKFSKLLDVRYILVLSAVSQYTVNNRLLSIFSHYPIDSLIITRIDEVELFGPILSIILTSKIQVDYVCHGSNVPNDIARPNFKKILDKSFTDCPNRVIKSEHLARALQNENSFIGD